MRCKIVSSTYLYSYQFIFISSLEFFPYSLLWFNSCNASWNYQFKNIVINIARQANLNNIKRLLLYLTDWFFRMNFCVDLIDEHGFTQMKSVGQIIGLVLGNGA